MSPNPAGGPSTPEGRAISSQNALAFGLYAGKDFIRPGEEDAYRELDESLRAELAPVGVLETNLANEIRRAMWRLARCGEVEQSFLAESLDPTAAPDPMRDQTQAKLQQSVDRARNQYQRLLHKCTAELRKLQTERHLRNGSFDRGTNISHFGLCDWAFISKDIARQIDVHRRNSSFCKTEILTAADPHEDSFEPSPQAQNEGPLRKVA